MPSESHSAMAGAFATLESRAVAAQTPSGLVAHTLGPITGYANERYGVCQAAGCGERFDGASVEQVSRLFDQHAIDERHAAERARAAEVTPDRLVQVRESLREATARKGTA